jgi:peptidoglycan/xylan/chitin deacetylase (PgdA/CDA1 family)
MIRDMSDTGWEIGSHSYSHPDLTKIKDVRNEICFSKQTLEAITGLEINTFAYPYGLADSYLEHFVRDCGYISGAGLGPSYRHTLEDIFYFQRLPVDAKWTLEEFAARLPWKKP